MCTSFVTIIVFEPLAAFLAGAGVGAQRLWQSWRTCDHPWPGLGMKHLKCKLQARETLHLKAEVLVPFSFPPVSASRGLGCLAAFPDFSLDGVWQSGDRWGRGAGEELHIPSQALGTADLRRCLGLAGQCWWCLESRDRWGRGAGEELQTPPMQWAQLIGGVAGADRAVLMVPGEQGEVRRRSRVRSCNPLPCSGHSWSQEWLGLAGQGPLAFLATQPGWGQEAVCHHGQQSWMVIVCFTKPQNMWVPTGWIGVVTAAVSRQSYKLELLPAI